MNIQSEDRKDRDQSMRLNQSKSITAAPSNLVVALFTDPTSARDAIADLQLAGFEGGDIAIALSAHGKQENWQGSQAGQITPKSFTSGEHSLVWRLRHSIEHDIHSHGMALSAAEDEGISPKPLYSKVDLREILSSLGVAEDRIFLLDREIGENGALMFVNAGDWPDKVQSILEDNRGLIRTDMATEHSPSSR